ncbi:MAG: phosphotransferase [Burkholderiales bacterium]
MRIPQAPERFEDYLGAALVRAGLPPTLDGLTRVPLTGGRTGAAVERIERTGAEPLVSKRLSGNTWREAVMEGAPGGEARLWLEGVTRALPPPIECPMIDVARSASGDWWMLMRDVSSGILPRAEFGDDQERVFLDAIAALHARFQDDPALAAMPLATMRGTTRMFAESTLAVAGGADAIAAADPWVRRFVEDFKLLSMMLPGFLDRLGEKDAAFYLEMCRHRSWHAALDAGPQTLVHGDLRRANIAFLAVDRVSLIDWEFAARGPAATDIAWHSFLHFWAYPIDQRAPEEREAELTGFYLDALARRRGRPIDRAVFERQWDAAWLRILAQLGFCLIDGPEAGRAERCKRAIARARRILGKSISA